MPAFMCALKRGYDREIDRVDITESFSIFFLNKNNQLFQFAFS